MRDFHRVKVVNGTPLPRGWTDRLYIVGPNMAWTKDDFEDLTRERPETVLGYSIWLATFNVIVRGELRGTTPAKVITLDCPALTSPDYPWQQIQSQFWSWEAQGTKFETWHVHRVEGIWRVA